MGVDSSVTDEVLKKAYRKLAFEYHPDRQSGSEEKFREILEAYETILNWRKAKESLQNLSPDEKQKIYDHLKAKAQEKAKAEAHARAAKYREKKMAEQNRAYTIAVYSLIGILFTVYFAYKGYHWFVDFKINQDPQRSVATVIGIERNRVVYTFDFKEQSVQDRSYVSGYGIQMFADNGMPLKTGDQFIVHFSGLDLDYHKLDFYKISTSTFNRYIDLAAKSIVRSSLDPLKPSKAISLEKARCLALLVYDQNGLEGLAKIYHFDTNPLNKLRHNKFTWFFFKSSDDFKWAMEECKIVLE